MNWNNWGIVIFLCLFTVMIYRYRSRLDFQKLVSTKKGFPIVYLALLRTKVGLKLIDVIASRFSKILGPLSTLGIFTGFLGMFFVTFEIMRSTIMLFTSPASAGAAALVLPIEAKGVVYVPFVIWILSLAIIIAVHEGGHAIIARLHKIPVKSSGLAAFGVLIPLIPAAFVEPDEKELAKRPIKQQLGVLAAGPFANIAMALLLLPLLFFGTMPFIDGLYAYEGVKLNEITDDQTYQITQSDLAVGALVTSLDGQDVTRMEDFLEVLSAKKEGEEVVMVATLDDVVATHTITLGAHPTKEGAGYLGVVAETQKHLLADTYMGHILVFLNDFIIWLCVLNLGIGLFNLLPVGIVDGGRMAKLVFEKYLRKDHATRAYATVSASCLFVVVLGVVMNFIG